MANNDIHSKVYEMGVAITDIGRLIQSFALFIHKILASLITGEAGSTFYIAQNDFSADIGFPAMEAMNTKVMGIIESTFAIPVGQTMRPYFFGNGCWILVKKAGNVLKVFSLVQFILGKQGKYQIVSEKCRWLQYNVFNR